MNKLKIIHVNLQYTLILGLMLSLSIPHAYADSIPINGFMDMIYNQLVTNNTAYQNAFIPAAQSLYVGLMTIELVLETGQRTLRQDGASKLIAVVIMRLVWLPIFMYMIANPNWIQLIIDQATTLATNAGSIGQVTPSLIAGMGIDVFDAFIAGIKNTSFSFYDPKLIIFGLIILGVGLATVIFFALMGLLYLITKVEASFVLSVGIIMLGFFASDWTKQLGKSFISYIVAVSIKIIVTLIMLGTVKNATADWVNQINNNSTDLGMLINVGIYILLCTIILFFLILNIPAIAAGIVTGVSTAGLTNALAAGGAIVAAGAALAAGAGQLAHSVSNAAKDGFSGGGDEPSGGGGGGGTDDSPSGGAESMAPEGANSPAAPGSTDSGGGEESSGGISAGADDGSNSSSPANNAAKPTNHAKNLSQSAYGHLQNTESQTTVNPPSMGDRRIDI